MRLTHLFFIALPLLQPVWSEDTQPPKDAKPPEPARTGPTPSGPTREASGTSEGPGAVKASPYYLILDYLSLALWNGEPLTVCLRLENTTKQTATLTLSSKLTDESGGVLKELSENIELGAGVVQEWRRDFQSPGASKLKLILKGPEGESELNIALVRENTPWPADAIFQSGRWINPSTKEQLVLVTRRREKEDQRAFALVKWLKGDQEEKAAVRELKTLLCAPKGWLTAEGAGKTTLLPLGPYREARAEKPGVPPVLMAASEILNALASITPVPERVQWLLPPEDLELATDQRLYRIVLQSLLGRMLEKGVKRIELIPPFKLGVGLPQVEALQKSVRTASEGYPVKLLDFSEGSEPKYWQIAPDVYSGTPNDDGQRWIATKLLDK